MNHPNQRVSDGLSADLGVDLVYLCDWLPPDFGAVGQYALRFARERALRGEHAAFYGLSSTASTIDNETFPEGSLRIVRLKASEYDRTNLLERAIWTMRTNLLLVYHARRDMRACNEILFTGSPLFLLHFLAPLNVVLRKTLTYRITDSFLSL